jgi:hypothetical protein
MNSPILILAFNRPTKLITTLEAVLAQGPRKIYISQDGPRKEYPHETLATKMIIEDFLKCGKIYSANFLEKNYGTLIGIQAGISWFFSQEDVGFILEDDIILMPGALDEAEYAISFIDRTKGIASVNLRNIVPSSQILENYSTFRYSKFTTSHFWGTTSYFWNLSTRRINCKPNVKEMLFLCKFYGFIQGLNWFSKYLADYKLEKEQPENANWDIRWSISHAHNGWKSIYTNRNRIRYDGFGEDATHTKISPKKMEKIFSNAEEMTFCQPSSNLIDEKADRYLNKHGYGFTSVKSLRRILKLRRRISQIGHLLSNHIRFISATF